MNKTAIKNFSIWARIKLREEMVTRAGFLGITENGIQEPLEASTREIQYFEIGADKPVSIRGIEIFQREKLVHRLLNEAEMIGYVRAYENMIETSASDWFNRLIAIRFMEINEYAPLETRLLSSVEEGKQDPDLVSDPFVSDLDFSDTEYHQIMEWKNENRTESLFRFLLLRMCNELHKILPGMFEEKDDYSELFMRLSFIDRKGLIYRLVHDIDEDDWRDQVQIIGWIYQYYNSQLKDETFALLKKNIKITRERIPSATQLFTPEWIVRYMVENSLGRLWVEGHPDEELKQSWKYYLEEAKQEPEVEAQLADIRKEYARIQPEEILCVDCCMGSGHILVCMFDVLLQIYESVGYSSREAVRCIIEHNLYGLDIDERAYQLAYFAVMMKARQYDRRFFTRKDEDGNPAIPAPHVYAIHESNGLNRNQLKYFGAGLSETEKENAVTQVNSLLDQLVDAKEYGSILNVDSCDWELLRRFAEKTDDDGQMDLETSGIEETQERLKQLIDIGKVLAQKYHVVCTNPPYMGASGMDSDLVKYVKKNYPDSKSDLFAVFIERCGKMTQKNGYQAMITQHAWMFLSSYEKLREKLQNIDIVNMVHLGARAFEEIGGEVVQTTSFVFENRHLPEYKGTYCRLIEATTQQGKEEEFLAGKKRFIVSQKSFVKIPGEPIAYWVSDAFINAFDCEKIGKYAISDGQTKTGNNDKYLRMIWEVEVEKIGKGKKWVLHAKGGAFRRWFGNVDTVIDWSDIARAHYRADHVARIAPEYIWFRKGICWTLISGSKLHGFRLLEENSTFNLAAPSIFFEDEKILTFVLGFLNSKFSGEIISLLNPTLNTNISDIILQPLNFGDIIQNEEVIQLVNENIGLSRFEWNSFETSWDFQLHPLIKAVTTILEAYNLWEDKCNNHFNKLKENEEELNRIFIDIYGLQEELTPEVEDKDVTVRKADLGRDIRSLISYAVGCMFGRYSLDTPGLAYAGGVWDAGKYSTFIPDSDNCIPITDKAYFEDDIVCLFEKWIETVYGTDTLEENLDFIANALGNRGSTSREIIRNYFINEFFKNHCKIYQKRPIYWLFDSGKQNGFKALVYLHRYDEDTPGRVLMYLQKIQKKYETEIMAIDAMLEHITDHRQAAVEEKRREHLRKQIDEIKDYDERLEHMVNERIHIDLDDGVKVNYEKVQKDRVGKRYQILAPIK